MFVPATKIIKTWCNMIHVVESIVAVIVGVVMVMVMVVVMAEHCINYVNYMTSFQI